MDNPGISRSENLLENKQRSSVHRRSLRETSLRKVQRSKIVQSDCDIGMLQSE
jgi:hypothetical protein